MIVARAHIVSGSDWISGHQLRNILLRLRGPSSSLLKNCVAHYIVTISVLSRLVLRIEPKHRVTLVFVEELLRVKVPRIARELLPASPIITKAHTSASRSRYYCQASRRMIVGKPNTINCIRLRKEPEVTPRERIELRKSFKGIPLLIDLPLFQKVKIFLYQIYFGASVLRVVPERSFLILFQEIRRKQSSGARQ